MATCPVCKTFYLNDECPTCKKSADAPHRRRAPVQSAAPVPDPVQYPKPGGAKKKPAREPLSMAGWAGFCTFIGVLMCIGAFLCLFLMSFNGFIYLIVGSMPMFFAGKLCKCITEISKNQIEILNLLEKE